MFGLKCRHFPLKFRTDIGLQNEQLIFLQKFIKSVEHHIKYAFLVIDSFVLNFEINF